uniref:Uncharacterized protein n=1 Tax=Corethron hystrix TaxID=216773 RepID=A0A7S1BY16_9STRA
MGTREMVGKCLRPIETRIVRQMQKVNGRYAIYHGEKIKENVTDMGPTDVDEDIVAPHSISYDYDFYMVEVTNAIDMKSRLVGPIENSLGFLWAKEIMEYDYLYIGGDEEDPINQVSHLVVVMEATRFQTTIDDSHMMLHSDVDNLLRTGDYVSFYQACGPSYIRSIRRRSEMMTVFTHDPRSFDIKRRLEGRQKLQSQSTDRKYGGQDDMDNTHIELRAFGISTLKNEDVEDQGIHIQVRSVDDFWDATNYIYRQLQSTKVNAGVPVAMQIVPWHKSPLFQGSSGYLMDMDADICEDVGPDEICQVGRYPQHLKNYNMMINAEHLTRMDDVLKRKMWDVVMMQACKVDLNKLDYVTEDILLVNLRYLTMIEEEPEAANIGASNFEGEEETNSQTEGGEEEHGHSHRRLHNEQYDDEFKNMSAKRMRNEIFTHEVFKERLRDLRDYVDHYYSPCASILGQSAGSVHGNSIMLNAWYEHDECMDTVCIMPGVEWHAEDQRCHIPEPVETRRALTTESFDYRLVMKMYCTPTLKDVYGPPAGYMPHDHEKKVDEEEEEEKEEGEE